eukprot:569807-Alexandrium_andersonii.AAC.1
MERTKASGSRCTSRASHVFSDAVLHAVGPPVRTRTRPSAVSAPEVDRPRATQYPAATGRPAVH